MLSGEIRVMEIVEASKRRNSWMARQRRLVEWVAWREWCNAVHEIEKQAVEALYGEMIRTVLHKRLAVFQRRRAYQKALAKATTPRRAAAGGRAAGAGRRVLLIDCSTIPSIQGIDIRRYRA